jgi:DNA-binding NarL/FixJ family response regulator
MQRESFLFIMRKAPMGNSQQEAGRQVRILIGDRQPAVRSAVKTFLEKKLGLDVVGEAYDSEELLAQIKATHPDVVLLDWELPGGPAAELLATVRALDVRLKVIVLGGDPGQRGAALAAGADYFISKADPPKRLATVIHIIQQEGGRA